MKKIFFLFTLSVLIFPLVIGKTFASDLNTSSTTCDDGQSSVGNLEIYSFTSLIPKMPFLVSSEKTHVTFSTFSSDEVVNNEVYFKLGSSSWVRPGGSGGNYNYDFLVGSERCGFYWINVAWRSKSDRQIHYCNLYEAKYDKGPVVNNFLRTSCVSSSCTYSLDPKARWAGLYGINISFPGESESYCSSYKLDIYGTGTNGFSYNLGSCRSLFSNSGAPVGENVTVGIKPSISNVTYAAGNLALFDLIINGSWCGTYFPNIPSVTPTPTVPVPTPSVCPIAVSQEVGSLKLSINNEWKYYVTFMAPENGVVNKVSVKAGNWGSGSRNITCKIVGPSGESAEKSSSMFTSSSGANFRDIDFTSSPFNVQGGTQYRLYCKGPDSWGSLYWIYSTYRNPESKNYRIYMCPD